MTINKFIKQCSSLDSPFGDLANDILSDENFPSSKPEREIIEYLDFKTIQGGTNSIFQEFLAEYRKRNNQTLKFILNYFKENNIKSIDDAMAKGIATSFVESCGYLIKIPVENYFPENVINDLKELETMNEKWVEISDGEKVQSHMLTRPNINDGNSINFCCQEIQFDFLLSLTD
ncbi:YozE family protein [Luteirhabdus pelagi]|uniref:YozE family protein n=1 Tax=Luteirhabdus pelagi TaxID=2792783 RepID=UPI00193A33B3|nr:YozE family protein [Luteirhabdus pelagi]